MSRGRRYDTEPKLNLKKVFAVIIAIAVIIMFILIVRGLLTKEEPTGKIVSKSYYASFKDNKWGVIDSNGNNIIDPSYAEMIIIPDNKTGVFICTYDVNYDTGNYKTKVLNEKNEQIFVEYDKVEQIYNKDKNNNLIIDKNVLKVGKDGKYGLIDFNGKMILSIQYDDITAISEIENTYKITKDGQVGIAGSEGNVILQPQYTDVDVLGTDNKSGFIVKNANGKYGIVNFSNEKLVEFNYDGIEKIYGNDLYVVTVDGKEKVIDKNDKDVLTSGFDSIKQILANQENAVIFVKSNKYGVMNTAGEVIIPATYDSLEETKTGILIAQKGKEYGIINASNEEQIPFEYTSIMYDSKADIYILQKEDFSSDILNGSLENKASGIFTEINDTKGYIKLRVNNEYKYYNFKFEEKAESDIFPNRTLFLSKKDGKYGYVDKTGKVIVDYIYDDAMEQNDSRICSN